MIEQTVVITCILTVCTSVFLSLMGAKFLLDEQRKGFEARIQHLIERDMEQQKELNQLRAHVNVSVERVEREADSVEQFGGLMGMDHNWRKQHAQTWNNLTRGFKR